jgi:hypothetical protein
MEDDAMVVLETALLALQSAIGPDPASVAKAGIESVARGMSLLTVDACMIRALINSPAS